MPNLLFFDIDGTLVDEKTHRIPKSALNAMSRAQAQGSRLFINTGRCKSFMPGILREFPFDGYSYACGAHIEYQGSILFERLVPEDELAAILDAMTETKIQGSFQGPEYVYLDKKQRPYPNFQGFIDDKYRDYRGEIQDFYAGPMRVNKMVTFRTEQSDYFAFLSRMKPEYQKIEIGGGFMEMLPLPYTKATAIDFLADYFDADLDDCYVFGDSPNDLPMMTHVKHSICLGNGYDSVKNISEYVTTDIDDDGIQNALMHYGLI